MTTEDHIMKSSNNKLINSSEIVQQSKDFLKKDLNKSGAILYSGIETLQKGEYYLLGINPGGSGGNSLAEHIDHLPNQNENAYLDEDWISPSGNNPEFFGKAPYQKRVQWLLESLEQATRNVFASNLNFFRTPNVQGITMDEATLCWNVHELMLDIVKPHVILSIGNADDPAKSAYAFIKHRYGGQVLETINAKHAKYSIKILAIQRNGSSILVIGFPHFSRYNPEGKVDIKHLREIINKYK